MKTAPGIGFRYRCSRLLAAMTLAVALLACVAVWTSGAPSWLRVALTLFIAACAGTVGMRMLRPRVRAVLWHADGGAELTLAGDAAGPHREARGEVHAARVMGPLILLTLHWSPRRRATLWLLPDNLDPDTRRRLRMRLGARTLPASVSGNADSG